jgi:hypothetical protein
MQTNNFQRMEFEVVQAADGSSMYVDVVLPSHLARVTVGRLGAGRGYCDTEIVNTETEETLHWQHQEFDSSRDLSMALTSFFSKLRALPAPTDAPAHAFELPLADKNVDMNGLLAPLLAIAAG